MMTINEFIQKYRKVRKLGLDITTGHTPHVVCKDGFKMSVQASGSHYCEPKTIADEYTEFEIGYPSQEESMIMKYCEDYDNPCGTVYGYVPCSVIDEVIEKHGGIDEDFVIKKLKEAA